MARSTTTKRKPPAQRAATRSVQTRTKAKATKPRPKSRSARPAVPRPAAARDRTARAKRSASPQKARSRLREDKVRTGDRSGAPEIMVALNNEHRYIASLLDALAEQADNLLPGRTADHAMMADIVRYMVNYPDEFHHPREDLLFDRLVERDPDSTAAVRQLQEGHREMYRRSRELLNELQRVTAGAQAADNTRLKYLCDRYIGYYWDHINTEESTVFPRATAKLRSDDWYAVNSRAKYVDDPLFGTRVRKEYQRLSQYLSTRVERVTEDIAVAELFGIEALIETVAALGTAAGEVQGIVRKQLRLALRNARRTSGDRFAQRSARAVLGLPGALFTDACKHAGTGVREIGGVVQRTRGELAEPFSTRLGYLRKLLG